MNKIKIDVFKDFSSNPMRIADEVRNELISLLTGKRVIPCYTSSEAKSQKWASIEQSNAPCLADADLHLAEKFAAHQINVAVVSSCKKSSASRYHEDESERFSAMCRFEPARMTPELALFWLELAALGRFSTLVFLDLENITESLQPVNADLHNKCRRLVPYIQSFLFFRDECRPIYEKLKSIEVRDRLDKLKIYRYPFRSRRS